MSITQLTFKGNLTPDEVADQFSKWIEPMKPKNRVRVKSNKDGSVRIESVSRDGQSYVTMTKDFIMSQYHGCTEEQRLEDIRQLLNGINAQPVETEASARERLKKKRQELPAVIHDEAVEYTDPPGSIVDNIEPVETPNATEKFRI